MSSTTESASPVEHLSFGLRARIVSGPSTGTARTCAIGPSGLVVGADPSCGLVVDGDKRVSRRHVELQPHPGGARVRDLDSTNGTFTGGVRLQDAVVPPGALLSIGDTQLVIEPDALRSELPVSTRVSLGRLIGASLKMRSLYTVIERAAPTDYTILVEGETGTGKEALARTIHEHSTRREGPFTVFDCASTAESVLESELFGHIRGAFTGALEAREGAFRSAHGGTLFIDELSSLPLAMQAKLLRALESRRVKPVGSDREVDVDIRVVAATNRPLADEVKAGRFREDLFYRLCVVRIVLPPLRERTEDIPQLVEHFLRAAGNTSRVAEPKIGQLCAHTWPGNLRELRNTIERALALAGAPTVPFSELPITVGDATPLFAWPVDEHVSFRDAKDALVHAFERRYAAQLLTATRGNISEAARRSGLSRRHFFELVRRHGLQSDAAQAKADDSEDGD